MDVHHMEQQDVDILENIYKLFIYNNSCIYLKTERSTSGKIAV